MMKHEPLPNQAAAQDDTPHELHRDYELRSKANLKKVGLYVYANDPTTEIICIAYAVDGDPVRRWFPGDPVPQVWHEAAANPNWTAVAHNDPFESAIEKHILRPRYGFPIIPVERHCCTQAVSLSLALPAKLGLLADVMEFANRKDAAGERLMHQMTKPRKPGKGEDSASTGTKTETKRSASAITTAKMSKSSAKRMVALGGCRTLNRRCGCSQT